MWTHQTVREFEFGSLIPLSPPVPVTPPAQPFNQTNSYNWIILISFACCNAQLYKDYVYLFYKVIQCRNNEKQKSIKKTNFSFYLKNDLKILFKLLYVFRSTVLFIIHKWKTMILYQRCQDWDVQGRYEICEVTKTTWENTFNTESKIDQIDLKMLEQIYTTISRTSKCKAGCTKKPIL